MTHMRRHDDHDQARKMLVFQGTEDVCVLRKIRPTDARTAPQNQDSLLSKRAVVHATSMLTGVFPQHPSSQTPR